MIAAIRPTSWDLPLFLHVAGAMTLVGAASAALVLAFAGMRHPDARVLAQAPSCASRGLARLDRDAVRRRLDVLEAGRLPGHSDPGWISIGYAAADAGLIILLVPWESPTPGRGSSAPGRRAHSVASAPFTWPSWRSPGSQ